MKRSCKVIKTKPIQTRVTVDNPKNAEIMKELFSQYASTPRFCHNMSTRYLVTANGLKLNLEPTVPLLRFKKPDKADFTYYAVLNPSCFGKGDMGGIFEVLGTWKFNAKDKSLQYKLKPQDKTRLIKFVANPDKYFANEYAISQRFLYLSAKYKVDPGSSDNAFLMRKLPGLTMASIIESLNKNPKAVPTKKRFELSIKLLKALAYVHEKEVIHRDIKPENIVVSDDEVFIIDFGLSAQKPLPELQGRSVGTPLFTDPLYLNELIQADEGTDLFSMVMVLAMLWGDTSRDPLQSMDDLKKRMKTFN